eukprot:m.30631 g.30631  ORF g.30631 m.30631 type:complete len:53 (+) comp9655_c0_seq1:296-454(+)
MSNINVDVSYNTTPPRQYTMTTNNNNIVKRGRWRMSLGTQIGGSWPSFLGAP